MEAIIFCGIQASGKTTFYRERFFNTHVRISRDLLRTKHREDALLRACLETRQPFVIDNTNILRVDRARFILPALAANFKVTGYFFATDAKAAFARNRKREGKAAVPAAGLFGAQKRLQLPTLDEGFSRIVRVELIENDGFRTEDWLEPTGDSRTNHAGEIAVQNQSAPGELHHSETLRIDPSNVRRDAPEEA